ncbi:MAG: hypothetical protein AB7E77_08695 [Desulfobulbus sp.]
MSRILMLLLLLLACPSLVFGGQTRFPPFLAAFGLGFSRECDSSQLSLLPKKGSKAGTSESTLFRLDETLQIRLDGACAAALDDALSKRGINEAVRLHLDQVAMVGLPVAVLQGTQGDERIVSFQLRRQSQQEENRTAWDTLFAKQHGSYTMVLPMALSIDQALPVEVRSIPSFRFAVVSENAARITNAVCLLVFAVLYFLLVRSPSALRESRNGVYSLGKSQMAFWGLLVLLSFLGLWVLTGSMERIPEQVLALLGISGATGLGSLLITTSKLGDQAPMLTNSTARDFLRDILDDGNGFSLHRMQVVAWTLILGTVFFKSVNKVMSMPEFPETLLLLMGISNGLYLGFKFPEKQQAAPQQPTDSNKPA